MILEHTTGGHVAKCPRCGWTSRAYSVPDTAYKQARIKHKECQ